MSWSRRKFTKVVLGGALAAALPIGALKALSPAHATDTVEKDIGRDLRWGFLVDTVKCVGCGFCVKACKQENEIPMNIPMSRTWVERYVVTSDYKLHIDSPNAGLNGFTNPDIRGKKIDPKDITKAFFVPKLCNQCENPPCVQVCPVGATYQTDTGVTLVDREWCIGCAYCIMACPYGARFFHPVTHTAEKCTFCYHRITNGLRPACVDACAFGARHIANLKDPADPVTKTIQTQRVIVLKEEYGTKPKAYYIGLDENVR